MVHTSLVCAVAVLERVAYVLFWVAAISLYGGLMTGLALLFGPAGGKRNQPSDAFGCREHEQAP